MQNFDQALIEIDSRLLSEIKILIARLAVIGLELKAFLNAVLERENYF